MVDPERLAPALRKLSSGTSRKATNSWLLSSSSMSLGVSASANAVGTEGTRSEAQLRENWEELLHHERKTVSEAVSGASEHPRDTPFTRAL